MGLPDSHGVSRVPCYLGAHPQLSAHFRLQGYYPLWLAFPGHSTNKLTSAASCCRCSQCVPLPHVRNAGRLSRGHGLGSFPFARRYLGNHCCFLFLRVLRCFSSPGMAPHTLFYSGMGTATQLAVGCPIRVSTDRSLLAAPRGFSQLAAPFFALWHQGIHRMPLFT